jgi:hypothetical protein
MEGFREIVDYCGFGVLGYSGLPYTWDNRRQGITNIKVCLDRALANPSWLDMFGDSMVQHIQMCESNHSGLLIRTKTSRVVYRRGYHKRPFRYENMSRRHHTYYETVSEAWNTSCLSLGDVRANLGNVQMKLYTWEHDEFGNIRKELHQLRQKLEEERRRNVLSGLSHEEHWVMNILADVLAREEIMEKQRSRIDWLKVGDQNTGGFHANAKQQSRIKKIVHLK